MNRLLIISLITLFISSCDQAQNNSDLNDRKEKIIEIEKATLTKGQIERKARSIKTCQDNDIPTIESLPAIESESEITLRTKEAIINRALVLNYLGLKSEGLETELLAHFENKYKISEQFTPIELQYKNTEMPSQQQTANANWRYESLHVLLWSLGYIDSLVYPDNICNVAEDTKIIFQMTKQEFIDNAKLRTKEEILNQADLIYRIHWACVNARIKKTPAPGNLNTSVVYERHFCLNWLISYMDQSWDNVSTDT